MIDEREDEKKDVSSERNDVGAIDSMGSEQSPTLEQAFRCAWSDNADAMALMYAGTGALKRDYTRYGRRTRRGVFADGANALARYYMNHYRDPTRQEVSHNGQRVFV